MSAPVVTLRQAEALVGLPYEPGQFDCAHLAVMAQYRLFGRKVQAWVPGWHPTSIRAQHRLLTAWRDEFACKLSEADEPQPGDAVLFRNQVQVRPDVWLSEWHIGTLVVELGERWVLHNSAQAGSSVLERLQDCQRRGLHLDGFYRWRTRS